MPKQRSSCFDGERDHVDAAALVVMSYSSALHRRLDFACPLLLGLELVFIHEGAFMAKIGRINLLSKFYQKEVGEWAT